MTQLEYYRVINKRQQDDNMHTNMSIRDLTRSAKKLAEYDYIDIKDKKSHEYKGVFVSSRYADEVKRFLETFRN